MTVCATGSLRPRPRLCSYFGASILKHRRNSLIEAAIVRVDKRETVFKTGDGFSESVVGSIPTALRQPCKGTF